MQTDNPEKLVQSTMNLLDVRGEESLRADGPEMRREAAMMVLSMNPPDLDVTRTGDERCHMDDQEKTIDASKIFPPAVVPRMDVTKSCDESR